MEEPQKKIIEINENKLAIAALIVPMSIVGTLIRIALTRLETFPGMPVFSLVYAQWVGCLIIGIVAKNKSHLFSWYYPLHPGISTGLCGSITTFSSWQLGIFKEFANYDANPHTRGKNVLAALSVFLVTLAMSLNGLTVGHHIGEITEPKDTRVEHKIIPRGFSIRYMTTVDYITIVLGIVSWLAVIFAAIFGKGQKDLAFACVFAPVGALTRWYLSFYNGKLPHFPIGTFSANIFGTAVLAALTLIQSGVYVIPIGCDVIQGLADGYCGCLTTISTFTVELTSLAKRHAYFYGLLSVVIAQCCMFIILGSYIWSQGIHSYC
ncbi:CrcB-like protein-domain-containing protein [Thamnidium elegans]|nr:CrcB-like protein-domain-containing protein [Thamnidium elegans]